MTEKRRLPVVGPLAPQTITVAAERAALASLKNGPREQRVPTTAAHARAWLLDTIDRLAEVQPPERPIACAEGCAFCCHLKVIATPVEVLALAAELRRTLSADALAAVIERVQRADVERHGLDTDARARMKAPCPLLEDHRCVGYAARPLHCMGACSMSRAQCERAFESPDQDIPVPIWAPQNIAADTIAAGLSRAIMGTKLDGTMLELVAGLRVALEHPDAEDRWRKGEPIFASAHDAELAELVSRAR
jgi:hypothetical protein